MQKQLFIQILKSVHGIRAKKKLHKSYTKVLKAPNYGYIP